MGVFSGVYNALIMKKNIGKERKIIISSVLILFLVIALYDFNFSSLAMKHYQNFLASISFAPNTGQLGPITDLTTGNVGIGTSLPTSMLDINGQLRVRGGSPALGRILTSDASGLATWEDSISGSSVGGKFAYGGSTSASISTDVICHPNGDTCSITTGNMIGSAIPFSGIIKNLYAAISTAPSGSNCVFTIKKSLDCTNIYSDTALTCTISSGQRTCNNTISTVSVSTGNCLQIFFDEQTNCSGLINWGFEFLST